MSRNSEENADSRSTSGDVGREVVGRRARSTLRSYEADWKDYRRWCERNDADPIPSTVQTLIAYFYERSGDLAESTLRGRVAAIRHYHHREALFSPTDSDEFREFWARLQQGDVQPLTELDDDLDISLTDRQKMLVPEWKEDLNTIRDRAVILLGLFGDMRRSDLVAVDRDDISFTPSSLHVDLSPEASSESAEKLVLSRQADSHLCPVRAVVEWIDRGGIDGGPLFRSINRHGQVSDRRLSAQSVSLIVKQAAEAAGLDPSDFSAEDLRQRPAK